MKHNKVRTTGKLGNYVSIFMVLAALAAVVASCEPLDQESDDPRDNLVGMWYCSETGAGGSNNFQVNISKSGTDTVQIFISNFSRLGNDVEVFAKLNGLKLNIPSQTTDGFIISGSGTVSSDYEKINWSYIVNDGAGNESFTAVYTK